MGTDVGRKVHIRCLPVIYQDQIVVAVTVSVYVGLVIVIYHKTVTGIVAAVSACRIQKTADFRCLSSGTKKTLSTSCARPSM